MSYKWLTQSTELTLKVFCGAGPQKKSTVLSKSKSLMGFRNRARIVLQWQRVERCIVNRPRGLLSLHKTKTSYCILKVKIPEIFWLCGIEGNQWRNLMQFQSVISHVQHTLLSYFFDCDMLVLGVDPGFEFWGGGGGAPPCARSGGKCLKILRQKHTIRGF